jgi:hypothetical protein
MGSQSGQIHIPSLPLTTTISYTMDSLLSQLKGQGSPFASPSPTSNNVEKLLDTIHLLSQATLLVAQQLQEPTLPAKAKPIEVQRPHLPTPRPTPKPSPPPTVKKATPLTPPTPVLSWVPRSPEYYSLPSPNTFTLASPASSVSSLATKPTTPFTNPTPSSIKQQGHTKSQRKPKRKRTHLSNPAPQPTPQPPSTQPAESAPMPSTAPPPILTPLAPAPSVPIDRTANPLPNPPPTIPVPLPSISQIETKAADGPTPLPNPDPTPIPKPNRPDLSPHEYVDCPAPRRCSRTGHKRQFKAALHRSLNQPHPNSIVPGLDPLHPEYPNWPSKPRPQSFEDPDRDPFQLPITGSGIRMDDGKWYPVHRSPSPPGKPADPLELGSFTIYTPEQLDDPYSFAPPS